MRVLVVDDEPDICRFMSHALGSQGMVVDVAPDSAGALSQLAKADYDVVLLDVLMPGTSGVDALPSLLQAVPDQRVIMVSALVDSRTKVRCLELGAVDYLSKPFALAELVARVRIHGRGKEPTPPAHPPERRDAERRIGDRRKGDGRADESRAGAAADATHDDATHDDATHDDATQDRATWLRTPTAALDTVRRRLHIKGEVIDLSQRETVLLAVLMSRNGDVCTRQELLALVWGSTPGQSGNVVDVYVGRLRAKLPANSIATVRNAGYAFVAA